MRTALSMVAIGWVVLAPVACAHGPSPEARASYFDCRETTVPNAMANLEAAGYRLAAPDDPNHVETGWTEFELTQDDVHQQLMFRIKVDAAGEGLRFSIWESSTEAQGERPWTEVTEYQVKEDTSRALLNRVRRDVCGGEPEFFRAP